MATVEIPLVQVQALFLIFLRVGALIFTLPLFENRSIPTLFKTGMILAVSILLLPMVQASVPPFPDQPVAFGISALGEVLLGVFIGLSARLIFTGVQLAGQLAGFQMGFALANVLDPATSGQVSLIGEIYFLFAMLIFMIFDIHHQFIVAVVESFRAVPLLTPGLSAAAAPVFGKFVADMFVIAIRVGAPVIVSLLLTSVALGLVARTVPQMNIFIVAMPLKIFIGLIFVGISLPYLVSFFETAFETMVRSVLAILRAAA